MKTTLYAVAIVALMVLGILAAPMAKAEAWQRAWSIDLRINGHA
ncbi:hypothetical protein [Mycobacterium spongiae]|nr:hypothetical protein [Mycobacterium spongiae]